MKTIRLAAAIVLLLVMSACVPLPSLNPLWDEGHAVSEPALTGAWISSDNDEIITIAKSDGNEYLLACVNSDSASRYVAHAVRLERDRLELAALDDEGIAKTLERGETKAPLLG